MALWTVVVLSFLCIGLGGTIRQKVLITQKIMLKDEVRRIADAGAKQAIFHIDQQVPVYRPFWMGKGEGSQGFVFGRGVSEIVFQDENSKVNLNTASPYVLKRLFHIIGGLPEDAADKLAYAVKDFRDADDHVSVYFDKGSEKASYERDGLGHFPKNADFELVSELLLVRGMTKEIYSLLLNYITIYGGGGVNINTCDMRMFEVLEIEGSLASKLIQVRAGVDGRSGTADDLVFKELGGIVEGLATLIPLTEDERVMLEHAITQGYLTTTSEFTKMTLESRLSAPKALFNAVGVYQTGVGMVYWAEY